MYYKNEKFRLGCKALFGERWKWQWFAFAINGLASNGAFVLLGYAALNLSVASLGSINALVPFFTLAFSYMSWKRLRELSCTPTKTLNPKFSRIVEGLLIGIFGVLTVLLIDNSFKNTETSDPDLSVGACYVMGIIGTLLWGIQAVWWKNCKGTIPDIIGATSPAIVGLIVDFVLMVTVEFFLTPPGVATHLDFFKELVLADYIVIVWLGFASGFLLQVAFFMLITRSSATFASQTQNLVPVVGLIIGVSSGEWKGQSIDLKIVEVIGVATIIIGISLSSRK